LAGTIKHAEWECDPVAQQRRPLLSDLCSGDVIKSSVKWKEQVA
jgi:hypothetical protein